MRKRKQPNNKEENLHSNINNLNNERKKKLHQTNELKVLAVVHSSTITPRLANGIAMRQEVCHASNPARPW